MTSRGGRNHFHPRAARDGAHQVASRSRSQIFWSEFNLDALFLQERVVHVFQSSITSEAESKMMKPQTRLPIERCRFGCLHLPQSEQHGPVGDEVGWVVGSLCDRLEPEDADEEVCCRLRVQNGQAEMMNTFGEGSCVCHDCSMNSMNV